MALRSVLADLDHVLYSLQLCALAVLLALLVRVAFIARVPCTAHDRTHLVKSAIRRECSL